MQDGFICNIGVCNCNSVYNVQHSRRRAIRYKRSEEAFGGYIIDKFCDIMSIRMIRSTQSLSISFIIFFAGFKKSSAFLLSKISPLYDSVVSFCIAIIVVSLCLRSHNCETAIFVSFFFQIII
jgi:hypothetical protein